jgi:hypothetical protein
VRKKFVRVRKRFTIGPIVHHQKPPATPFLGRVHGIACDSLLDLGKQCLRLADEEIAHVFAAFEFILPRLDRTPHGMALDLHDASAERDPAAHRREESERSLASDIGGLARGAIFQDCQQRKHGALRK